MDACFRILWPTERYAMAIAPGAGEPGCKVWMIHILKFRI